MYYQEASYILQPNKSYTTLGSKTGSSTPQTFEDCEQSQRALIHKLGVKDHENGLNDLPELLKPAQHR